MAEIKLHGKEQGILRYINHYRGRQNLENIFETLYPLEIFDSYTKTRLRRHISTLINETANTRIIINNNEDGIELVSIPKNFVPSPIQDHELNKLDHDKRYAFDIFDKNLGQDLEYKEVVRQNESKQDVMWLIRDLKSKLGMTEKKVNRYIIRTIKDHYRMINLDFSDTIPKEYLEFKDDLTIEKMRNYLSSAEFLIFKFLYTHIDNEKYYPQDEIREAIGKNNSSIEVNIHRLRKKLSNSKLHEMGLKFSINNHIRTGYKIMKLD